MARQLKRLPIIPPKHVWAMNITYIPVARGFIWLAAVLDWFTRRVLASRVDYIGSGFLHSGCGGGAGAPRRARVSGRDHGSQFASIDLIKVLAAREIGISLDDKDADRIHHLTKKHPIRPTSTSPCPNRWRHNRGENPLKKCPEPVQIN